MHDQVATQFLSFLKEKFFQCVIQWPVPSLCPGLWVGEEPETDIKEDKNTCFAWLETRYISHNHQNIEAVKQFYD